MALPPHQRRREQRNRDNFHDHPVSDHSNIKLIEERLVTATQNLHKLSPMMGLAKQVIEFQSDMRKNILAKHARRYIESQNSAANSEMLARSDPAYEVEIKVLQDRVTDAYKVEAEWRATLASVEVGRSLLAMQRETMNI